MADYLVFCVLKVCHSIQNNSYVLNIKDTFTVTTNKKDRLLINMAARKAKRSLFFPCSLFIQNYTVIILCAVIVFFM
jgi:hypothetical protein